MYRHISKIALGLLATTFITFGYQKESYAIPFSNGSFDDASAWIDVSAGGTTSISGGQASLSTASGSAGTYSAVLSQGDDGSFTFSDPITLTSDSLYLNYDIRFETAGADAAEGNFSSFDDYLGVSLYDAFDWSYDLSFVSGDDFAVSTDWATVSLDVSSLIGRDIALAFELHDEANATDTTFWLDNISFSSTRPDVEVPEPSMFVLFLLGLAGLAVRNLKADKRC